MSRSLRKQLAKNGYLAAYEGELEDYLKRAVLSEVSRENIANHQKTGNPVCFISHHPVICPEKAITVTSTKIG